MQQTDTPPPPWPTFQLGFGPSARPGQYRVVLPFRRSWPAIAVAGGLFAALSIPLVAVGGQVGAPDGDLFSLTFSLFSLFWLIAWSVGVAIVGLLFLVLLLGGEVVVATSGALTLRLEILGLGVAARYDPKRIGDLRVVEARDLDGRDWRGAHLAFDYFGKTVAFGSEIATTRVPRSWRFCVRRSSARDPTVPPRPSPHSAQRHGLRLHETTWRRRSRRPARWAKPTFCQVGQTDILSSTSSLDSPSTLTLILANLVPAVGVAVFGWDLGEIMILYWAESAVIGLFNLFKMVFIGRWAALLLGPFFLGHYGCFMVGHLLFIYAFFIQGINAGGGIPVTEVVGDFMAVWPALLALLISHGASYRLNFIGRREFANRRIQQQMREPYARIVVMHVTIILGGFVAMALGTPLPALLLLIALKTAADARGHIREHRPTGVR